MTMYVFIKFSVKYFIFSGFICHNYESIIGYYYLSYITSMLLFSCNFLFFSEFFSQGIYLLLTATTILLAVLCQAFISSDDIDRIKEH